MERRWPGFQCQRRLTPHSLCRPLTRRPGIFIAGSEMARAPLRSRRETGVRGESAAESWRDRGEAALSCVPLGLVIRDQGTGYVPGMTSSDSQTRGLIEEGSPCFTNCTMRESSAAMATILGITVSYFLLGEEDRSLTPFNPILCRFLQLSVVTSSSRLLPKASLPERITRKSLKKTERSRGAKRTKHLPSSHKRYIPLRVTYPAKNL
jgi:hypothetical protein